MNRSYMILAVVLVLILFCLPSVACSQVTSALDKKAEEEFAGLFWRHFTQKGASCFSAFTVVIDQKSDSFSAISHPLPSGTWDGIVELQKCKLWSRGWNLEPVDYKNNFEWKGNAGFTFEFVRIFTQKNGWSSWGTWSREPEMENDRHLARYVTSSYWLNNSAGLEKKKGLPWKMDKTTLNKEQRLQGESVLLVLKPLGNAAIPVEGMSGTEVFESPQRPAPADLSKIKGRIIADLDKVLNDPSAFISTRMERTRDLHSALAGTILAEVRDKYPYRHTDEVGFQAAIAKLNSAVESFVNRENAEENILQPGRTRIYNARSILQSKVSSALNRVDSSAPDPLIKFLESITAVVKEVNLSF